MIRKIIINLFLSFLLLAQVSTALHAQDKSECASFNTYSFYFDFDPEVFIHCVYYENGRLNIIQDDNGSIPIFKALFSDIEATYFDHFIDALSDEDLEKMTALKDRYGTTLLEIATEADYLDNLVRLLSSSLLLRSGLSADQLSSAADLSDTENPKETVLDARIADGSLDFAAVLKLAGAVPVLPIDLAYSEALAMFDVNNWKEVNHSQFMQSIISVRSIEEGFCDNLINPQSINNLSPEGFEPCVKGAESRLQKYLNYYDKDGKSFLHLLIEHSSEPSLIDLYLGSLEESERESSLSATDINNYKPIHTAARFSSNPAMISHLIGWGADINSTLPTSFGSLDLRRRNWGIRPIHIIVEREDDDSYRMLLRALAHEADANAQDTRGNTPLHILLSKDITDVSSLTLVNFAVFSQKGLLAFGNDEKRNEKGATPLLYAVSKKKGVKDDQLSETAWRHAILIEDLIAFGSDVDTSDQAGWSPLLYYAYYGYDADTFSILLESSKKACKAKTKEGVNVLAAIKQNEALMNGNMTNVDGVSSPIGLYKQKCRD